MKLVVLLLGLAAGPALAEGGFVKSTLAERTKETAFRGLDKDGDGYLSRKEAAANQQVSANFHKADANRDGRLSRQEFNAVELNRTDQPGSFSKPDRG